MEWSLPTLADCVLIASRLSDLDLSRSSRSLGDESDSRHKCGNIFSKKAFSVNAADVVKLININNPDAFALSVRVVLKIEDTA